MRNCHVRYIAQIITSDQHFSHKLYGQIYEILSATPQIASTKLISAYGK